MFSSAAVRTALAWRCRRCAWRGRFQYGARRPAVLGAVTAVVLLLCVAFMSAMLTTSGAAAEQAGSARPAALDRGRPHVPALPDATEQAGQGVRVTFETLVPDMQGKTDVRADRLMALYVPAGSPPTPLLPAGRFRATFETDLTLRLRDEIAFSIAGRGTARLIVNGEALLETRLDGADEMPAGAMPVRLSKGKNRITLRYEGPEAGDAVMRLYWASADFPAEPVPPALLSHDISARELSLAKRVREGRELFANLRCAACHADAAIPDLAQRAAVVSDGAWPARSADLPMPDLAADAPSLDEIGGRVRQAWLAHWINDPRAQRPGATMPRLFHGEPHAEAIDQRAADIAAFLVGLGEAPHEEEAAADEEMIAAGGRLFAHLRCAGCHTLPEAEPDTENQRTPLHHVKAKFYSSSLAALLRSPEKHYAWTRMPNFGLSEDEASSIATFLLSREQKELELPEGGDAGRGGQLIASAGCLNCHSLRQAGMELASSLKAPALAQIARDDWTRGCLAADDRGRGRGLGFALSKEQREAILAFAATDRLSLGREALAEFAQRQVRALNCIACHARDGEEDRYAGLEHEVSELAGDEQQVEENFADEAVPSPDQSLPELTWAGEKLKPDWMARLLQGRLDYRVRPWLRSRMPSFAARGALLAQGLSMQHGFAPASPPDIKRDAQLADVGRKLAGQDGGFACTACHGVGPMRAVGVFEAPGMNFQYVSERVNRHYYDRWMFNPLRVHRETKMPAFADKDGQTSIIEIFGGDGRKQFEAIYHYLLGGRKIEPPEN